MHAGQSVRSRAPRPARRRADHCSSDPGSWSHQARFRSEAAFASFAGVSPIPASSGLTSRHRLNRSGDRQLNRAMPTITLIRMRLDPPRRRTSPEELPRGRPPATHSDAPSAPSVVRSSRSLNGPSEPRSGASRNSLQPFDTTQQPRGGPDARLEQIAAGFRISASTAPRLWVAAQDQASRPVSLCGLPPSITT
ncbi:transposase [Streptomyces sp. NPDC008121]|uniref:transposase n=1 Tax=Streptomyces sp. NPDC008121 TaxID=3364809 RepID=UPI0036E8E8AA